jgi:hypothetical protein
MGQPVRTEKMWRMKLQLRKRKHYCHTWFIDNASRISKYDFEYADKERTEVDKVFVTGCLSERYRPDLEKKYLI